MFEINSAGEAASLENQDAIDERANSCHHSFNFNEFPEEVWVYCVDCEQVPGLNIAKVVADSNYDSVVLKAPKSLIVNGGPLAQQAVNYLSAWEPLIPGLIAMDLEETSDGYEQASLRINSLVRSVFFLSVGGTMLCPNFNGNTVDTDVVDRYMEQLHDSIMKFGPEEPNLYDYLKWSSYSGFTETFYDNDGYQKIWGLIEVLLGYENDSSLGILPVHATLFETWRDLFISAGEVQGLGNSGSRAAWGNDVLEYIENPGGKFLRANGETSQNTYDSSVFALIEIIHKDIDKKLHGVAKFAAYSQLHASRCVSEKYTDNLVENFLRDNLLSPALADASSFSHLSDDFNPFKILNDPALSAIYDYERLHKVVHDIEFMVASLVDPENENKFSVICKWIWQVAYFQLSDGYPTHVEHNLILGLSDNFEPQWMDDYFLYSDSVVDQNFNLDKYLEEEVPAIGFRKKIKDFVTFVETIDPKERLSNHIVLTGNPGTGKTTIARVLGKVFAAKGLLTKGHVVETSRSGMVAGYVGQTAIKTRGVISEAVGGILFIDEAYSLKPSNASGSDYGQEAIDTLLLEMENNRENLIVIAAGYSSEMDRFVNSNPGLSSRFPNVWNFPDLGEEELWSAFKNRVVTLGWNCADEVEPAFKELARDAMGKPGFGNARWARNLAEASIRRGSASQGDSDLRNLLHQDSLKEDSNREKPLLSVVDALKELEELQGLHEVKRTIKDLVAMHQLNKRRVAEGFDEIDTSKHLVFSGPPGTGKTTVARLVGKIYNSLGILPSANVRETGRSELVAGYIGQTAIKTQEVLDQANGGTLFIDEAYSLSKSTSSPNDFGSESIEAILKYMEDNRETIAVVIAGYSDEMEDFIGSNPGLKSRFTKVVKFEPFNAEDYVECILNILTKKNVALSEAAIARLKYFAPKIVQQPGFASGRDARNDVEKILLNQARRLALHSEADLRLIEVEDLDGVTDLHS